MFMRLLRCPKSHVSLVDMPTQMKMGFFTKQNQAKITRVVLNSSDKIHSFLIDISLFLENLNFVWKQLYVIVNDSLHSHSWSADFLRQSFCRLLWWLFKTFPYCLNNCHVFWKYHTFPCDLYCHFLYFQCF